MLVNSYIKYRFIIVTNLFYTFLLLLLLFYRYFDFIQLLTYLNNYYSITLIFYMSTLFASCHY